MRDFEITIYCDPCWKQNDQRTKALGEVTLAVDNGRAYTVAVCGRHESMSVLNLADFLKANGTLADKVSPLPTGKRPRSQHKGEFPCKEPGCEDREPFDTNQGLNMHMTRTHKITPAKRARKKTTTSTS